MSLFRLRYFILVVLIPLIMSLACGAGEKESRKIGGTVVIGMKGDFDSFNELNASDSDALQVIQYMLFMSLTKLDSNLNIVPYLAKSWKFSDAGKALTYQLRKDVQWSDGVPTTAEDVLFTYQMAIHPEVAYPAASRFDLTEQVEVIDPSTVRFYFKQAYPDALFDTQIPILPKHILGNIPPGKISQSDFNRNPMGNGPFILMEWRANRHVIFESNPQFAMGPPSIDKVVFTVIPDESVLFTNLATGEIDIVPSLSAQNYNRIRNMASLQAVRFDGRGHAFIAWNQARPLFTRRICRALTHAIDKKEIVETLLEGLGKPAKGPFLPFVWAYDDNLQDLSYNPELAKAILEDEDWVDRDGDGVREKEGQDLSFSIKTNAGSQLRNDVSVMIQAQLKDIGAKVDVQIVEYNLLLNQVFGEKDFDAFVSGWDVDFTVNPTDLYHSKAIQDGYNFVSYQNSQIDRLLDKARTLSDRDQALPLWREFQQIILRDCPYTFLFITDKLAGYNTRVKGIRMDVRSFISNIHQWWIAEGE